MKKKLLKILIISRYPPFPGGRENFVFELASSLSKKNKILILTPDLDYYKSKNIQIRRFPKNKGELLQIIKAFDPDIINSHTFYLSQGALEISRDLGIPFGITLHGDQFAIGNKQRQKIVSDIVQLSDFVINVSANGKKSILHNVKNLNKKKVYVINNGVNLNRFKICSSKEKSLNRSKLNIERNKFVILVTTRIATYKGLNFLIGIISKHKTFFKNNNTLFLVSIPDYVFSKEENELFFATKIKIKIYGISDLIRFIFFKYQDVTTAYSVSDIFLLPSQKEQFPISILEAMACKVPIVATSVGGIPELLEDGVDCHLVPFGNKNRLYKAIKLFIYSDSDHFTTRAYNKVFSKYSIVDISKEYYTLYLKYINDKNNTCK